jgi:surface antigen
MKMIWKLVCAAIVVPVAIVMGGCAAPSPEECSVNNTARGALVGAAGGAALGVGIAALAHATGSGFGLAALGGAVVGGIAGAIIGAQQDKACHQMALKQALDRAAEQAAQARQAEAAAAAAAASASASSSVSTAKAAPATVPEYQTVAWANAKTGNRGAITPLGPVEGEKADAVCMTYVDQQIVSGKTESVTAKACRAPDGEWKPVT